MPTDKHPNIFIITQCEFYFNRFSKNKIINIFNKIVNFDLIFWFNMFVITILSTTFATSIYFIGASKLGAKEVSSYIFLVPASALIIGSIFLGEKITSNTIIGTICTIIAIYILNNLNLFKLFKKS